MNQDNFYKKLRIICLILAIICMGLSLVKRAKAAELSPYYNDYVDDIFLEYINNTNDQTVINAYNSAKQLGYFGIITGYSRNQSVSYKTVIFSSISSFIFNGSNWSSSRASFHIVNVGTLSSALTCEAYMFVLETNNSIKYVQHCTYNFNDHIEGNYVNTQAVTNNILFGTSNDSYIFDNANLSNNLISNGDFKIYSFVYSNGSNYKLNFTFLEDQSVYHNTDGFKVFKTTRSGRDYLIFDGLNAVPVNIRNGNWYLTDLTSTLGFTVTTETGSYDYSYTFDIDDASEEFPYNGTYFKWQDQWSNLYLRWEIPIDELNLPDDAYGFTENVIMTVSNNVSINNVTIPYLGQFIYLSPVYIYGTQAESDLIDPETAPAPVIPENPINQETRNKNYQSLVYGTLLNKSGLEFEEWKQDLQSGVIWYEVLVTQAPSLQDLINDFPNFSTSDIEKFVFGCNDKEEFENDMETDLQKNSFSQYIDYIVYIYNGSDAYHSSKFDYYIFETSKGREKAISFLLDTNNTYFDKQFDILKDSIPYIKASIDRIDTNLFNLGEDIFSQNNSIIANLISIDNKFNDLEDLLKDFLNKILNALQGINIDIPAADYSSITSRLDQIISNQGTGDLNNDWYDDYRSWLYGKDLTDDIISPHEFFIEVFVPIKNTYDAFVNNNAIAGYIADMDLFVEYLSGKIDDNLSIYFKDGIGSAQFDINDNTMLTAGGT